MKKLITIIKLTTRYHVLGFKRLFTGLLIKAVRSS